MVVSGLTAGLVAHIRNDRAIVAERVRFAQAEKDVQNLSDQVQKTVARPDNFSKRNTCAKSVREYGTDTFFCNVGSYSAYGVQNSQNANNMMDQIDGSISNSTNEWVFREITRKPSASSKFITLPSANVAETLNKVYFSPKSKLICDISYDLYNSSLYVNPTVRISSNGEYTLLLSISCGGDAKKLYY